MQGLGATHRAATSIARLVASAWVPTPRPPPSNALPHPARRDANRADDRDDTSIAVVPTNNHPPKTNHPSGT